MLRSLLLCALLLPLLGCGDDAGNPDSGDPTKVTYAEALGVDLSAMTRLPSGLYIQDLGDPGTGAVAQPNRRVQVHYTGWLPSGTQFDSSRDEAPLSFTLGVGAVIKGWDEGIEGMKVGGSRRLVIPSELGYGERGGGGGVIPPHSVLIFDTELMFVR
ncbi:FKBP-type peptidyl-prolyl cis-trans isomerase [Pyxidicoccus xibeiensis]|uniref:FKBP-type peptidyl-prolyl cis-trans isomerase n=1 Tax=Pyxidicoccus xibeiensis TaxID=2906759 RepID=UPI0020A82C92|nr:FKBP-type peptidyl-prolyl cis-trans isomerase [Pyxidicoccus xibeiensis]MCP3137940.1 FKBP-type peptidyl-prolyl cis-trans isomerase [Pyxidicoccus xibeiensis]